MTGSTQGMMFKIKPPTKAKPSTAHKDFGGGGGLTAVAVSGSVMFNSTSRAETGGPFSMSTPEIFFGQASPDFCTFLRSRSLPGPASSFSAADLME